jgi:hypothetical protein
MHNGLLNNKIMYLLFCYTMDKRPYCSAILCLCAGKQYTQPCFTENLSMFLLPNVKSYVYWKIYAVAIAGPCGGRTGIF